MTLEINIASPRIQHEPRARELIDHLKALEGELGIRDGVVYYDYPLFRDADDVLYRSKVLLVSRSHGLALFLPSDVGDRACTPQEVQRLDEQLSQLSAIIYGKLLKSRVLRRSRQHLLFTPESFVILSNVTRADVELPETIESHVVRSLSALDQPLAEGELPQDLSDEAWSELRSILEGAKGLLRPKERTIPEALSHGKAALLARLESEIATFDAEQRRAALSIVEGPQRIRGLAGSGKTIVLAMKAAHLHLSDEKATILVTFHTKSLYDFIKRLITRFYRQFDDQDPDFEDRIHVLHSWGGRSTAGVYYNACTDNGQAPLNYSEAQGKGASPFAYVCQDIVKRGVVEQKYDYVLIDEAQDLPASFFKLCFQLTKGGQYDRNIVFAYDDLQNIMNVGMVNARSLFGVDGKRVALIDIERASESYSQPGAHDIVLHRCYRNPREILLCAHALGFGIYSDQMVQMLENKEHWEDVGYKVEKGNCRPGEATVILRPQINSPLSISDNQDPEEIVSWLVANNIDHEVEWVVDQIEFLIKEGLRADDIMVVSLDDWNARTYFTLIATRLEAIGLRTNNVLASVYNAPQFSVENQITLSTVYRAKGNEAPVVFVVGVEAIFPERKLKSGRNKLFTAFTRAKGWLRVSGIGDGAQFFVDELSTALKNCPRLEFIYPDPAAVDRIQRDLSDRASRLRKLQTEVAEKFDQLDLDTDERAAIADALSKRKKG